MSVTSKFADLLQKATVLGLTTITVLGVVGSAQAYSARIETARNVKAIISRREQELIAEHLAAEAQKQ